jgi:hypothetical protein
MPNALETEVRDEIVALHEFFVGWFSGRLSESSFEVEFTRRFDPEFVLIPPAGVLLNLRDLQQGLRARHGSNPNFGITIRNIRVLWVRDDLVLATYEEWQRNALASTPPDNARIATVLFQRGGHLTWLHVHETWMPHEVMAAGPYDF